MGCRRLRRWWQGSLRVSGGMGGCGVERYLQRAPPAPHEPAVHDAATAATLVVGEAVWWEFVMLLLFYMPFCGSLVRTALALCAVVFKRASPQKKAPRCCGTRQRIRFLRLHHSENDSGRGQQDEDMDMTT